MLRPARAAARHLSDKTLAEKVRLCTRASPQPCWTGSPYQPIPVAQHVSDTIALQIMEQPTLFPGVTAQLSPVVDYPDAGRRQPGAGPRLPAADHPGRRWPSSTSRRPGSPTMTWSASPGLEAQYNAALTGKPGTQVVSVNAAGDVTRHRRRRRQPQTGDTLVTSLNAKVQAVAQQALTSAIARARARRQRRQPGRGRRGDDHRPDRGDGQLPRLRPERVDQRRSPSRRSTTCSAWAASRAPASRR